MEQLKPKKLYKNFKHSPECRVKVKDEDEIPSALSFQVGGDHYKNMPIQLVEFIHANDIPFIEGTIIKYILRWRGKGKIEDLEKAKHYIDILKELESKN